MLRVLAAVLVLVLSQSPSVKTDLVFLTRGECPTTPDMALKLGDALKALGWGDDYQVINIDKLSPSDMRRGYPTPTLLWKGRDVFGMPALKPPFPPPT